MTALAEQNEDLEKMFPFTAQAAARRTAQAEERDYSALRGIYSDDQIRRLKELGTPTTIDEWVTHWVESLFITTLEAYDTSSWFDTVADVLDEEGAPNEVIQFYGDKDTAQEGFLELCLEATRHKIDEEEAKQDTSLEFARRTLTPEEFARVMALT
jgi:hypothetical protein